MELWITIIPDETPFHLTLNEIKLALIDKLPNSSFVLCREVAKREHYHLYLKDPMEYSDKTRNSVRRQVRSIFEGEIRIAKRQVEDKIRTIAYTIKDGNYITHKIDWWVFKQAKDISHPKPKGFQGLISDFYLNVSGKDDKRLVNEVLDIFDTCNIPIDLSRIAKIVRLSRIKQRDASYRKQLVDRIIDEI